jgi:predicted DNA-binding transcriptional regulator AlpA
MEKEHPFPELEKKLLLAIAETCKVLSVSRRTLYGMTWPRGPIKSVKLPLGGVRYSVDELKRWIAEQVEVAK